MQGWISASVHQYLALSTSWSQAENSINQSCDRCDAACVPFDTCMPALCLSIDVIVVVLFSALLMALAFGLLQIYLDRVRRCPSVLIKIQPKPWMSLKKAIYWCGIMCCMTRIVRYSSRFWGYGSVRYMAIALGSLQQRGDAGVFFDQILDQYGLCCLYAMFSLLSSFWRNLCRKNNTSVDWFDSE